MSDRRVVVTGLGTVNPLGSDVEGVWKSLLAGESGIGTIESFDASHLTTTFAGEVRGFDPDQYIPKRESRRLDRFAQLYWAAAHLAIDDSGLDYSDESEANFRAGVATGSGIGGMDSFIEGVRTVDNVGPGRVSPFTITKLIPNMAGGVVSIAFHLYGPNVCHVTACAASANALADAVAIIQRDEADVMVAGGAEAPISEFGVAAFATPRAISTRNDDPQRACRPFDAERDGFVMAEGSAVLVLEEREHALARGAKIYCEIAGFGMSADGFHVTLPRPGGVGAARAMSAALRQAGLAPEDIDYINAHGTSTPANDVTETAAIKLSFGEHARKLAISSTKSMTGHLLGGAGAFESMVSALALRDGVAPPTINYEFPDPECDLDYVPNEPREMDMNHVMSNSFGFGGHNVSLVFKKHS